MKIYTKTGDDGTTALFSGGRVKKDHPRLEAYGTLDELNAVLGLVSCEPLPEGCLGRIVQIQESLFSIGGALADIENRGVPLALKVSLNEIEEWIDGMDKQLPQLRAFILPGGSRPAALVHLARTVCRRAERRTRSLTTEGESVPQLILPFLNRLSDYFFVLARFINYTMGISDPEWRPER